MTFSTQLLDISSHSPRCGVSDQGPLRARLGRSVRCNLSYTVRRLAQLRLKQSGQAQQFEDQDHQRPEVYIVPWVQLGHCCSHGVEQRILTG